MFYQSEIGTEIGTAIGTAIGTTIGTEKDPKTKKRVEDHSHHPGRQLRNHETGMAWPNASLKI